MFSFLSISVYTLLCDYFKSQELQEKEHQLLMVKNDLRENMYQTEQLKKQLEALNSILESTEEEKLRLTKQLHENLEEVRCVTEERDSLRQMEGTLKMEGDQLRESLRETEAKVSYTPTSSMFF